MTLNELRRHIADKIRESRDLKRTDDATASRILDLLRGQVCLPDDARQGDLEA